MSAIWLIVTIREASRTSAIAIESWVKQGGSLLLITDHDPDVKESIALAQKFGFELWNTSPRNSSGQLTIVFKSSNGSLEDHAITSNPDISHFVAAHGSMMRIPDNAEPIFTLPNGSYFIERDPNTKKNVKKDASGFSLGGVRDWGAGRIAVFNEASGFNAQIYKGKKFGMNAANSQDNAQFTLNLLHWLSVTK